MTPGRGSEDAGGVAWRIRRARRTLASAAAGPNLEQRRVRTIIVEDDDGGQLGGAVERRW
jgi:hypothetical protein